MNTIKNHTIFANGILFTHTNSKNEYSKHYGISSIVLKNNNTKSENTFTSEREMKIMKSLSNIGISKKLNKSRYDSISRRLRKFYKDTFSTKADWSHIVDNTGGVLKIWLTNITYGSNNHVEGDIHLLKECTKANQSEIVQYSETIYESRNKGGGYGRYHDFSKVNNYKAFVHHTQLEVNEMRGGIRKLKADASLNDNTIKTNEVIDNVNGVIDNVNGMTNEIEALKAEIEKLKLKTVN